MNKKKDTRDEINKRLTQWIDVVENEGDDDVNSVGFVRRDGVLILVTRALTILRQRF